MEERVLLRACLLFLSMFSADALLETTTFTDVIYRRAVPHWKGVSLDSCVNLCLELSECWGVNHLQGIDGTRGECQLLYNTIASCSPAAHQHVPALLNAVSVWVRQTCPLQRTFPGQKSLSPLHGKRLLGDQCLDGSVHWRVYEKTHVRRGDYTKGPRTFLDCLDSCVMSIDCAAVDFDFVYDVCYHFGVDDVEDSQYRLEDATCCAHARIPCNHSYPSDSICISSAGVFLQIRCGVEGTPETPSTSTTTTTTTTVPPITTSHTGSTQRPTPTQTTTTTTLPTSTATSESPRPSVSEPVTRPTSPTEAPPGPTARPPWAIPTVEADIGCPGEFLRFDNSGRQGGTPVFDLPTNTSDDCKKRCLDEGDKCMAIDFDRDTNLCYTFNTADPQALTRGNRACCDHYVKLDCEALATQHCYKHSPMLFLANPNEHNIIVSTMPPLAPPDLEVVPCSGVCFQHLDHNPDFGFFSLERGCNTSVGAGRTWRACSYPSEDPFNFDRDCSCAFDRCNGISTFFLDHLTCYYPFDGNARDLSGFTRHGRAHGVTFDPTTSVRGYSAMFDGQSSYIHFPTWRLVHPQHIGPDGRPLLSFTIIMWVLRPMAFDDADSMTLLSTFARDQSTVQIVSDLDSSDLFNPVQTIRASIIVNHTMYDVRAEAPLGQWFFLALTLDGLRETPRLALDIDDLENLEPEASVELTGITALDEMTMTNLGLYIGKQVEIIRGFDQPYYFKGYIDDFFCYDTALSYHELLAIKDMTLPLP